MFTFIIVAPLSGTPYVIMPLGLVQAIDGRASISSSPLTSIRYRDELGFFRRLQSRFRALIEIVDLGFSIIILWNCSFTLGISILEDLFVFPSISKSNSPAYFFAIFKQYDETTSPMQVIEGALRSR